MAKGRGEPVFVIVRGADLARTPAVQYAVVFERELILARAERFHPVMKLDPNVEQRRPSKRWRR